LSIDFKKLKSNSGSDNLDSLKRELEKLSDNNKRGDDRFWTPTVDKAGVGSAVIRFLPAPPNEDLPFTKLYDHGFKGPTGLWYIENSLTSIGKDDPVSEYNSKLWNSTTDDKSPLREQVRKQKRRLHYISNVYVVQDNGNPSNEGKVFLFKYGAKIFEKLKDKMEPQYADEVPLNPFDLWTGANFKLKIRNVEGYRNYDRSEFDSPGPLLNDDDRLEAIWKSEHSLKQFLDPSNFKPYEELKAKLVKVLALEEALTGSASIAKSSPAETRQEPPRIPAKQSSPLPEDDEDVLDFLKKLQEN
jgi:hypothetical protein